jgi:hypothetical protein
MPLFERYRRSLASVAFPPALEAQFHLQTAESYEALEQFESAIAAGERARQLAEQYGFHKTSFAAEAVIVRAKTGESGAQQLAPDSPVPASLRTIASTIGQMRRLVPT